MPWSPKCVCLPTLIHPRAERRVDNHLTRSRRWRRALTFSSICAETSVGSVVRMVNRYSLSAFWHSAGGAGNISARWHKEAFLWRHFRGLIGFVGHKFKDTFYLSQFVNKFSTENSLVLLMTGFPWWSRCRCRDWGFEWANCAWRLSKR